MLVMLLRLRGTATRCWSCSAAGRRRGGRAGGGERAGRAEIVARLGRLEIEGRVARAADGRFRAAFGAKLMVIGRGTRERREVAAGRDGGRVRGTAAPAGRIPDQGPDDPPLPGDGWAVAATMGHVKDLPASKLGVDVDNGFAPQYVVIKDREKVLKAIVKAARGAKAVYLAPDPDREGERSRTTSRRSCRAGIPGAPCLFHGDHPAGDRERAGRAAAIDVRKFESQPGAPHPRSLVGYQLSPVLWKKVQRGSRPAACSRRGAADRGARAGDPRVRAAGVLARLRHAAAGGAGRGDAVPRAAHAHRWRGAEDRVERRGDRRAHRPGACRLPRREARAALAPAPPPPRTSPAACSRTPRPASTSRRAAPCRAAQRL